MDSDSIKESPYTGTIEPDFAYDACLRDLDDNRFIGLRDLGDYQILFLLS